jgi:hypothetical protein
MIGRWVFDRFARQSSIYAEQNPDYEGYQEELQRRTER